MNQAFAASAGQSQVSLLISRMRCRSSRVRTPARTSAARSRSTTIRICCRSTSANSASRREPTTPAHRQPRPPAQRRQSERESVDLHGGRPGVDEPAADIPVTSARYAIAMATGRVIMAMPRHVPLFTPPGGDPYQREIFIRHQIGAGRYAEVYTAYFAHMQDTAVRRGQNVVAGTVLGRIGTTRFVQRRTPAHFGTSPAQPDLSRRVRLQLLGRQPLRSRQQRVSHRSSGWQAPAGADPWAGASARIRAATPCRTTPAASARASGRPARRRRWTD